MKALFDELSAQCSRATTIKYSTSFSLGIKFLSQEIRKPIYNIYGFVRFADEIVDSFEGYNQEFLMRSFERDLYDALENKISLNPILNSFQATVHDYNIEVGLIDKFLESMKTDLSKKDHNRITYEDYILGSAEVVGLMCLKVFVNADQKLYEELKPYAMSLGAAFQKVNFLRDIKDDYELLGRSYFPGIETKNFSKTAKIKIEVEIEKDFEHALEGIKMLPPSCKAGVYLAYIYYQRLFTKIKATPAERIMSERVRIPNANKVGLMFSSMFRYQMNML